MDLQPGRQASVSTTVTDDDTAAALRSGEVPVLGTPRVVALVEQAAIAALDSALPPERTSVGAWVALEHLAP
ncbi:MAG: thioesterase family protein, partial [Egibacteraceae bacterium]